MSGARCGAHTSGVPRNKADLIHPYIETPNMLGASLVRIALPVQYRGPGGEAISPPTVAGEDESGLFTHGVSVGVPRRFPVSSCRAPH